MGTNLLSTGILTCAIVGLASADSGWSGSPAARSWERATGTSIDLATEAPILDGNILRIIDRESGRVNAEFVAFVTASVPIDGMRERLDTSWGADIEIREMYSLTSGFVVVDGEAHHFAFMQVETGAETSDDSGNPLAPSVTLAMPVIPFDDSKDADEFMADVLTAANGEGGSGGIYCSDPTWRGRDGVECCGFLAAYRSNVEGCRRDWWKHLWGCVAIGAGGGFTFFQWCVKTCVVVPPPANAGCAKACLLSSGLIGLEAALVCVLAANDAYEGCIAREQAAYILNLTNSGCELRIPEEGE